MRTYETIINTIDHAHRFGNKPGVEISAAMLEAFGHPEKAFPFIHVAGTNGKGSVCAFLDSMLREKGMKVGLFTSPHLIDFEERIIVDGKQILKEDVTRLGNLLLDTEIPETFPTYFDYCLMMAVLYFKEQKVDIAIMETGLGGTLDSTNALGTPLAAVIAKIGFDHMAILGNSLAEIASEKAGIMKPGAPVWMETQEPEALQVLASHAREIGVSRMHIVSPEDIDWVSTLSLQLPGVHQWENGALAAETAAGLFSQSSPSFNLKELSSECSWIRTGLERTVWPGRMELLSASPFFMVDGAHNGHGVHALKASLIQMYPGEKFHFFMGVLADKDYQAMVELLLPLALDFHTITPESHRALQADALAEFIRSKGIPAKTMKDISEIPGALYPEGKNIAFGSLYFVGDLKTLIKYVS